MDEIIEQPVSDGASAVPARRRRRIVTVALSLVAAVGVGVGATALASAATTTTTPSSGSKSSGTTAPPTSGGGVPYGGGFGRFGAAGFGGFGGPGGSVLYGQYTVQGPNGYETIDERSGTVSAISNTSGSTWSLTVASADGTSATFTVDASTSVNGGETGISSVKSGDTVSVVAVVSNGTATATQVTDRTTLQANGSTWMPRRPTPGSSSSSGSGAATAALWR